MSIALALGVSAAAISASPPVASAGERDVDPAHLEECRERLVIAPGVEEAVRPAVPARFELRRNSAGQPLLYVSAIRCETYVVDGVGKPTNVAAFGVSIEPPDGTACFSRAPVVGDLDPGLASCNVYLLFAAYDNEDVVEWTRALLPDNPVHFTDDLVFDQGAVDLTIPGAPFRFASPSTPSAYEMDLVVRERPLGVPATATFWHVGASGTIRVRFEADGHKLGQAEGSLKVEPGSRMADLFGTTTPTAQQPFPLLSGNKWEHATLTQTLLP